MNQAEGIDSLRGFEGEAGRLYFFGLPGLLRDDLDEKEWTGEPGLFARMRLR